MRTGHIWEPQLFAGAMVLSILGGLKTQTRRILSARNSSVNGMGFPALEHLDLSKGFVDPGPSPSGNPGPYLKAPFNGPRESGMDGTTHRIYSKVQPGDHLWVQESYSLSGFHQDREGTDADAVPRPSITCHYLADGTTRAVRLTEDEGKKLSARKSDRHRRLGGRFMYRSCSRVVLEITGVRLERLNDISKADAIAEGLEAVPGFAFDPREAYCALWESLHGAGSWARNPWVWVRIFRRQS